MRIAVSAMVISSMGFICRTTMRASLAFSQQSCHQGPFENRRDLEPIDSEEPDPHAAFAEIAFEVYRPLISYERFSSDFLFPPRRRILRRSLVQDFARLSTAFRIRSIASPVSSTMRRDSSCS